MRLHLDTTFLIDWQRRDPRVDALVTAILNGDHRISVDPIVQTEFFAATQRDQRVPVLFATMATLGDWITLTSSASTLAASWLAPFDRLRRRAHFADALIAAIAVGEGATLVTADIVVGSIFPVDTFDYRTAARSHDAGA